MAARSKPARKPEPEAPKPAVTAAPAAPKPVAVAAPEPAKPMARVMAKAQPKRAVPVPAPRPSRTAPPTITRKTKAVATRAAQTLTEGSKTMATTAEKITAETNAKLQGGFADIQGRAKSAMEKGAKFYEDMGDFTKGNVEALVASGRVAAAGVESLGQDAAAYGQKSLEQVQATFKNVTAIKSPTELFQLQSDYARSAFDALVAESSRMTEKMMKLTGEVVQPLSSRFAVAAEKVKSAAL